MFRTQRHNARRVTGAAGVPALVVAVPFGLMLFCAVELGMAYASSCLLEGGLAGAGDLMRTAQARDKGDLKGAFEARLCEATFSLIDCADISYEAIPVDSTAEAVRLLTGAAHDRGRGVFHPGLPGETVLIRAVYEYDFVLPLLGALAPGHGRFVSSRVITNERIPEAPVMRQAEKQGVQKQGARKGQSI